MLDLARSSSTPSILLARGGRDGADAAISLETLVVVSTCSARGGSIRPLVWLDWRVPWGRPSDVCPLQSGRGLAADRGKPGEAKKEPAALLGFHQLREPGIHLVGRQDSCLLDLF